jgi:hypothetical protein
VSILSDEASVSLFTFVEARQVYRSAKKKTKRDKIWITKLEIVGFDHCMLLSKAVAGGEFCLICMVVCARPIELAHSIALRLSSVIFFQGQTSGNKHDCPPSHEGLGPSWGCWWFLVEQRRGR